MFGEGLYSKRSDLPSQDLLEQAKEAWEISRSYLDRIVKVASSKNIKIVIVPIPHRSQIHLGLKRDSHIRKELFRDYHGWIKQYCENNKIKYLDIIPILKQAASNGEILYYQVFDAHWNQKGHQVAADALYEHLYGVLKM